MLMMRNLMRHGYSNVGMVTNQSLARTAEHQEEAAFFYYAARLRRKPLPPLVLSEWDAASFIDWFRRYLPDAVMTCFTEVVPVLAGAGYPVPASVGVALNWMPDGSSSSGVSQDFEGVGAAAFDLVEGQLQRHEHGVPAVPKIVQVRGSWMEGDTLR